MFYVYVLKSTTAKKHYIGQTSDLQKRLQEHNSGESKYTSAYIPWELVYSEEYETRSEAMKREKYLKSYPGRKWLFTDKLGGFAETNPISD